MTATTISIKKDILTTEFINHPLLRRDTVERRHYQDNIFASIYGQDALVVLPTGLGKTIVAILQAAERLTSIPASKVVLLAPTKPLTAQHQKTFSELMVIPEEQLALFTGFTPPARRVKLWEGAKIAFMTPQVLQNDLEHNRYTLADVSLLVFDEAHHAVGEYAYTSLAKDYLAQARAPRILGITASPGGTRAKINEIVAHLHVARVEIKTEESPDVRPYVHPITVEHVPVDLPPAFVKVLSFLEHELQESYRFLKGLGFLDTDDVGFVNRKQLVAIFTQARSVLDRPQGQDLSPFYNAIKIATAAIRLSHAHELLQTQGVGSLCGYFAKCHEEAAADFKKGKSLRALLDAPAVREAWSLANSLARQGISHPKVAALKTIIGDLVTTAPDSRAIVFAQFRDSASFLVDELAKVPGVTPLRFVGQASRGAKDKGIPQKKQIQLLGEFKAGTYNVLVATSVAEEGLDISEVDLVVFYEAVPSEIRTIQRRGRTGRKREGRCIMLVAKGTRDEGYLHAEKHKERVMKETIRDFSPENTTPGEDAPDGDRSEHGTQPQQTAPARRAIAPGTSSLYHWMKTK